MSKVLLVGVKSIKGESIIEENVDEKILSKVIANVQSIQLKQILGKGLYDAVCDEARAKALDNSYVIPEPTNELLNDYIQPFLINAVVAEFIAINNYKVSNKGVQKLNDNSSTSINSSEVEYIKNYYDNYVSTYKNNLIKYLQENDLIACGTDTNITQPSTGWYLEGYGSCSSDSDDDYSAMPFVELDPVWLADKPNYVPNSRTITINGVAFDLSANRSWTISTTSPTPNLQEVTDEGYQTTNNIEINGAADRQFITWGTGVNPAQMLIGLNSAGKPSMFFKKASSPASMELLSDNITSSDKILQLPNANATLVASINGNLADANGNIVLAAATTPTWQQTLTQSSALSSNVSITSSADLVYSMLFGGANGDSKFTLSSNNILFEKYDSGYISSDIKTGLSISNNYADLYQQKISTGQQGIHRSGYYGTEMRSVYSSGFNVLGTITSDLFGFAYTGNAGSYTFPRTTPTTGQVLIANASGDLLWGTITSGSNLNTTLGLGNTSSNSIFLTADDSIVNLTNETEPNCYIELATTPESGQITFSNNSAWPTVLSAKNASDISLLYLPDAYDKILAVSVNGLIASNNGDIALAEVNGATGQTAYTTGDILYSSASNTLSRRSIGSSGQVLTVSGGVPVWSTLTAGTVTTMSVVSANGFAGTVATATTTPAITISTSVTGLLKGNGTAISAATAGTDYLTPTGSAAGLTSFPTFNQNTTGSAATLTTARLINGTSFNGSADITITAAAGTLTGATLASGVTASSLTSFGGSPTMTGTLTVPTISLSTTISGAGTWTAGTINTASNVQGNNLIAAGLVRAAASFAFQWNGRSSMLSSADGVIDMRNNANSAYSSVQSLYQRFGSGSPEGVVTAPIGTYYSRTDGGANTSLYVKESGTGNTGWVAK